MIPLAFVNVGEEVVIGKVNGNSELKKHMEHLGFVTGGRVSVISSVQGNLILEVKGSRLAVSREAAHRIMVDLAPQDLDSEKGGETA